MIRFEKVSMVFDGQPVLDGVNLHVKQGEFIALVGETGAGKTTMLRMVYFDLIPTSGVVKTGPFSSDSVKKSDIPRVRRTLGVIFQDFKLLEDRNVYENVAFALEVTGASGSEIRKSVLRVLADIGLSHKRNSMPHELSGGEQQRVVIARAMVNEPLAILADEPTGNLDPATAMDILQLLKSINGKGTAVIMASHNYELVRRSGGRCIQLKDGKAGEIQSI